jgi:CheY-like chemotaxis protein
VTAILGLADLLSDTPLAPSQQELVTIIKEASTDLRGLVNDILDVTKAEAGEMVFEEITFDLHQLILDVVGACSKPPHSLPPFARDSHEATVSVVLHPDLPAACLGDKYRLGKVITSFVCNAARLALPGKVMLRAEVIGLDVFEAELNEARDRLKRQATGENVEVEVGEPFVLCGAGGGSFSSLTKVVRVSVDDTGGGMSPLAVTQLFRASWRSEKSATPSFGSRGLQLAISKHIAELMGGCVGARSVPGKGSTLWVDLPLKVPSSITSPKTLSQASGDRRSAGLQKRTRVLVAEDNLTNLRVVIRMLERLGWRADGVGDGAEAVKAIDAAPGKYAILIIDSQMPVMGGIEATREIREREAIRKKSAPERAAICIIGLSGSPSVKPPAELGMNAYLLKPVTIEELQRALEEASEWIVIASGV